MKGVNKEELHPARWYAVHLHSNFETYVGDILSRTLDGEVFVPCYFVRSTRRGKPSLLKKPLFAGYVFARTALDYKNKVRILSTRGVAGIVKFGGRPAPIDESVIRSLMILDNHKDRIAPHPYLKEGARVRVAGGPLAGARGIVLKTGKKSKLIVSVDILQRSVSVTIDPIYLEPDLE